MSAVRVYVSDARLLPDLQDFLRECGCVAEKADGNTLDVYLPSVATEQGARMELDVYLMSWRLRHQDVSAHIVS